MKDGEESLFHESGKDPTKKREYCIQFPLLNKTWMITIKVISGQFHLNDLREDPRWGKITYTSASLSKSEYEIGRMAERVIIVHAWKMIIAQVDVLNV